MSTIPLDSISDNRRDIATIGVTLAGAALSGIVVGRLPVTTASLGIAILCVVVAGLLVLAIAGIRLVSLVLFVVGVSLLAWGGVRIAPSASWGDALILGAALLALPRIATTPMRATIRRVAPVLIGAGLVSIGGIVGGLVAGALAPSIPALVRFTIAAVATPYVISALSLSDRAIRILAWSWVAAVGISSTIAIVADPGLHAPRSVGLTLHPNHLALTIVLAIGLAMGFVVTGGRSARIVGAAFLFIAIWALLLTGSRAGIVGALVAVAAVLILAGRTRTLVSVGLIGATLFMLFSDTLRAVLPDVVGIDRLLGDDTAVRANASRIGNLQEAIGRFLDYPLSGAGFVDALVAHNFYLQAMVTGGPIALFGALWIAWSVTAHPFRVARQRIPSADLVVAYGGACAGLLAVQMFHNVMWDRYIWVFLGMTAYLVTPSVVTDPSHRETPAGASAIDQMPPSGRLRARDGRYGPTKAVRPIDHRRLALRSHRTQDACFHR